MLIFEKEENVKIENLRMPPFNTTLMGVLRGVFDYYGIKASDPMVYGGSGHAFLMNIHEVLCPSGPYCWNYEKFYNLVGNLGIEMTDHGFFSKQSNEVERKAIETLLKEQLDNGIPCSLVNMEHQLITGYDETGFMTAQPWAPHVNFPPDHLTFGTWAEFGDECHVNFFSFRKIEPASEERTIADSLKYAVDLYRHPSNHTEEPYGVGADAYTKWIGAVKNGHGSSHGNWWNGTVWAECRGKAAEYFMEIASKYPDVASAANDLAADYGAIAEALRKASDKGMDSQEKIKILEQTATKEAGCINRIDELAACMG